MLSGDLVLALAELNPPWCLLALGALLALSLVATHYLERQYRRPLRQLRAITARLAAGTPSRTYYIDGAAIITEVARDLELLGGQIETLQRKQQTEDFNLNVLLANMVEGVMVVDRRHSVRLVNQELINLFGLKQDPVGRTVLESLREARLELILREVVQRAIPGRYEVTLENAGALRHVEVSAVPIRPGNSRETNGAVLVFHDISRIKQLELMRSELVANVSHELRTPLAIFSGYLETLIDNPGLPETETARALQTLRRHSNRLNALVEDLLVLTRLESRKITPNYESLRIDALIRQIVQDWSKRPDGAQAVIEIEVEPHLPPLEVDQLRFEQVMLNLLENAVAYSNAPRHITLRAGRCGEEMEIRVIDNGIGIPPGDLPHVFERFYRVDKARSRDSGGTGLGLAIVKQIVRAHRGTVEALSELGHGTTILIRLPLVAADVAVS